MRLLLQVQVTSSGLRLCVSWEVDTGITEENATSVFWVNSEFLPLCNSVNLRSVCVNLWTCIASLNLHNNLSGNLFVCRSQWPRSLRRRSAAARLLRSWVRIPPDAWMFVCCECYVLSGRGLCDELITRPEESYRPWCVVVCDLENSRMRRPCPIGGCCAKNKTKKAKFVCMFCCDSSVCSFYTCFNSAPRAWIAHLVT